MPRDLHRNPSCIQNLADASHESPMNSVESTFGIDELQAADRLIDLALAEDLSDVGDLTCQALIDADRRAVVDVVARRRGVLAGAPVGRRVLERFDPDLRWESLKADGCELQPGDVIARLTGRLVQLLSAERTVLNFLTHLSGIATLTQTYVTAVRGTRAQILDTRKTHPGYRRLEKYAVRCGGGTNHRMGLYDGILIKDNHLAGWAVGRPVAEAVERARQHAPSGLSIEVEVDTLEQLRDALRVAPDIVLLDNMTIADLQAAVALRDSVAPAVRLEASGGVTLDTVRAIAETGVERISIGALTHSAVALDIALDWNSALGHTVR